jgi:periplasmic protein CpxP/Spy
MYTKKLAVLLGLVMSAGMVMAQDQAQAPAQGGQQMSGRHGRQMDPDKAAARLGKKLNLSDGQVAQIRPILADQKQQMQTLRADTSLTQDDRRSKAKGIMQDSRTKMEAVMNDQQKQQFEQMLQEQKARRHGGMGAQSQPQPQ